MKKTVSQTFLRLDAVIGNKKKGVPGIFPMSKSSWYKGIRDGIYPPPVKLSKRSVAWLKSDTDDLAERLSRRG